MDAGTFDVVVVGVGVVGTAAALAAARLGERVVLVHNRPFLGGNASVEIGLRPRGVTGPLIDEISERHPGGDLYAKDLLDADPNATVFLEHTVYDARLVRVLILPPLTPEMLEVDARFASLLLLSLIAPGSRF